MRSRFFSRRSVTMKSRSAVFLIALLMPFLAIKNCDCAFAIGIEEARNQCRATIRPIVHSCVRQNVLAKGGNAQQYLLACRQQARPKVAQCVARLTGNRDYSGALGVASGGPIDRRRYVNPRGCRVLALSPNAGYSQNPRHFLQQEARGCF